MGRLIKSFRPAGFVLVLALALAAQRGEFAPLPQSKKTAPSGVEQVLEQVEAGPDGWLSERQAAEIEQTLEEFARALSAGQAIPAALVHPQFRGTSLRPSTESLARAGSGLEVFRGTVAAHLSVTAANLEAAWRAQVSDYRALDWVQFKIVGIESAGEAVARTAILFQIAGTTQDQSRQQLHGEWRCEWRRSGAGKWQLAKLQSGAVMRSRGRDALFTDVSLSALGSNAAFREQLLPGIEIWRARMDAATGLDIYGHQGVAVGDFDGDGLEDFYVCQPAGLPNRLFRNLGNGRFEEVSRQAGVDVLEGTSAALFADVDNNGTEDLILILSSGQPLLFLNDGHGHFRLSLHAFPPRGPARGAMMSAALADYDRDGFLDLYVCVYSWPLTAAQLPRPYYDAQNGPPNVMYRNRGDGTFEEVTHKTGLDRNNNRFSFACAWADYDHDGWPDLYVANDFGRNNLYHNNGDGTFTDVAAQLGVEDIGAGMSAAWGDYDGDGWEDLYVGNMWSSAGHRVTTQRNFQKDPAVKSLYQRHAKGNSLFRNRGGRGFEDVTAAAGVEMGRWAWCSDFFDFDNDGYEDLYIANGFITGANKQEL